MIIKMIISKLKHFMNRYCFINIRYYSNSRFPNKIVCKMDTAYFRYQEGLENYELTFFLKENAMGINRQFNFTRKCTETIGSLTERIKTNVDKCLQKKIKKKTSNGNQSDKFQLELKICQNGEVVSKDELCVDIINSESITQLFVLDKVFNVEVNSPWILNLCLPVSILAGFPVYPSKFDGLFLTKEHCIFTWYAGEVTNKMDINKTLWNKVGEGYTYFTCTTDIGKHIKVVCLPGDGTKSGPQIEAISKNTVEAGPGLCPFENRHFFTKEETSGNIFRVISYNILADLYCDSDFSRTVLYPYCPPYALHIDYRKQLLVKEILGYNSDIMCLQETDSRIFDSDLKPLFNVHGYEGKFTKKGGQVAEGLACFYKLSRFECIGQETLLLAEDVKIKPIFEDVRKIMSSNELFMQRLLDRSTVAQAIILQSIQNSDEIVVVGNTHLYFHPDADHIRIMQGYILIKWLNDILNNFQKKMPTKTVSLVICGDFNSVPSCGIYQLYTTGFVPCDLDDWKSNENEALHSISLQQPRLLSSACGTPEFTNYTVSFSDCLDYIFHDANLNTTQVIPFPNVDELKENTALPSIVFPSDHIALVADLQFT